MAQAEMALEGMALASPLPTAPPSPLELARRILPRKIMSETCGWVDADSLSPMACPLGYVCAHNTGPAYNAAFCCDALSFPANCPFATTCLDSTDVAASCTGLCLENTAVAKCTSAGSQFCFTKIYDYSTISTLITEWDCSPYPGTYSVYDHYLLQAAATGGASPATTVAPVISNNVAGASPGGGGSSSGVSTSTPAVAPATSSKPTSSPAPAGKSPSGGVIAGIVVGAIFVIIIGLGMILLYRFVTRRSRERRQQQPPLQQPQHESVQQGGATQQHRPSNITMPSDTPLVNSAMTEVSPNDSASQIGGWISSVSYNPAPQPSTPGSGPSSHPSSGLGPLPTQFQATAHQGQAPSSVASPGSAFGSMAPVHAPDIYPPYNPLGRSE